MMNTPDTKKQILHTSLKMFLQRSYKDVSLRDIVNELGLTKGALYHYYISKEEIFEEAVRYFYNHIMITDYHNFPKNSLKEFYLHYIEVLQNSEEEDNIEGDTNFYIFLSEASKRIPDFMNIHLGQRKKELCAWTDIIETAKKNKEIKSTIPNEEIASMFLNMSDGVSLNRAFARETAIASLVLVKNNWDNLYLLLLGEKEFNTNK